MKFSFKSKKGKSEQSPKTEDCFLLHSYICGFSEALSGNVSPQFPWNSSTACLAWRKNYIFVNISSIPEKGKEFKGKKDRPSLSEPGNCHRIFRFVSGYIPFNDVKFVWITCSASIKNLDISTDKNLNNSQKKRENNNDLSKNVQSALIYYIYMLWKNFKLWKSCQLAVK